jgi:S-formylglutathione hydrolase
MRFSVYEPPQAIDRACPVLFYLAGLTCTEETFMMKAGAQRWAAKHGLMLVAADTSPRGLNLPSKADAWDFGVGAGFYVDATVAPWSANFQMYSYITQELPEIVAANCGGDVTRQGIFGHSMGGHGALVCALRNPGQYRSLSALAPIVAPMQCPWGRKAFAGYLGDDEKSWRAYDATELIKKTQLAFPILIDQGLRDKFLAEQLKPQLFNNACEAVGQSLIYRSHAEYDHGYYFVATFMEDHIEHHARLLNA